MHVSMLGCGGASVYVQLSAMNPIYSSASREHARTRWAEVEAPGEAMELER